MPHRKYIVELLSRYEPGSQEEKKYKKDMMEFAGKYSNCFERSQIKGHFTASCWLLNKMGTKALLMHHTKLDRWFQLGGHADGEPNLLLVAVKEAQEESGIIHIEPISADIFDIDVHEIPQSKGVPGHNHYDVRFLLQVTSDEECIQNSESKELRWISKDPLELPTNALSVKRMFDKWLAMS